MKQVKQKEQSQFDDDLSGEEALIENSLESWEDAPQELVAKVIAAAKDGIGKQRKEARVNLRIAQGDLDLVKRLASYEGLPYQSLLASVIHKYVTGRLVQRDALLNDLSARFEKVVDKVSKNSKSTGNPKRKIA